MEMHGASMELTWKCMGLPWNYIAFHRSPGNSMKFHGTPWNSMEFHGVILYRNLFYKLQSLQSWIRILKH